ncbi:protein lifeguard 1-like [Ptychodera flava]|uniref:protein lifeguard 1-like n=1 Tax=Ptychodera flava TaxID=63121 RepID=UPI00396A8773
MANPPPPPSYEQATSPAYPPQGTQATITPTPVDPYATDYNTNYGDPAYPPQPVGSYSTYVPPSSVNYDGPNPDPPPASVVITAEQADASDTAIESGGFEASGGFSDKAIRRVFIRKVYLILMVQLLVTMAFVALFVFSYDVKVFVHNNSWIYWMSYGLFIVFYFVLVCCEKVRRNYPTNIIMLSLFTLCLSYMTGTISSFYDTQSVLIALGIAAGVCLGVTIFSMQTKWDFTTCGGLLFMCSLALFLFGFVCIFTYNNILQTVYAGLGALLFAAFLAFDTQLIMGGKRYEISPEEHIFAALSLYIDVVYIFLFILRIVGGGSNN